MKITWKNKHIIAKFNVRRSNLHKRSPMYESSRTYNEYLSSLQVQKQSKVALQSLATRIVDIPDSRFNMFWQVPGALAQNAWSIMGRRRKREVVYTVFV